MRTRIPQHLTAQRAVELQRQLASRIVDQGKLPKRIMSIVGCDASYIDGTTIAAAVSVNYDDLSTKSVKIIEEKTTFPYIPGLLAFREGPPVLRAVRALRLTSYVCMVDGHGVAHPRYFGLACFVGLSLDRPTIGVAKSLLFGSVERGRVVDRSGRIIAEPLNLPARRKTIYVSVGHRIGLSEAVEVVKHCITPLGPLPIRLAHEEVTKRKWQIRRSNPASS